MKWVLTALVLIVVSAVSVSSADGAGPRKIVVFDPATPASERKAGLEEAGCTIIRELSIVPAAAVTLPEQAADRAREAILGCPAVLRIEDDIILAASKKPANPG